MLAQKRNKIMYKNIFSNFWLFPIGHLTHPPTSKVFLDFYFYFIYMAPMLVSTVHNKSRRHEEESSKQRPLKSHVNKLRVRITLTCSPFEDDSHTLMTLDSHDCVRKDIRAGGSFRYSSLNDCGQLGWATERAGTLIVWKYIKSLTPYNW